MLSLMMKSKHKGETIAIDSLEALSSRARVLTNLQGNPKASRRRPCQRWKRRRELCATPRRGAGSSNLQEPGECTAAGGAVPPTAGRQGTARPWALPQRRRHTPPPPRPGLPQDCSLPTGFLPNLITKKPLFNS